MSKETDKRERNTQPDDLGTAGNLSLEDLAMKTATQYFGTVLLPYLGIEEELSVAMPTEQVNLTVRHLFEDFNYKVTGRNEMIHLEFESDSVKTEDLRRFREYEATTSRVYHVGVTTYVICSSTVKNIMDTLTEGLNPYRVHVIRLKDKNADQLFAELFVKAKGKNKLTRNDLIPLLLTPLMSGDMTQKDRILQGLGILNSERTDVSAEERERMSAVLYALANKFLDSEDLNTVKERIRMTRLGQMLINDGIEIGMKQGIEQGIKQGIERGLEQGLEQGIEQGLEQGIEQGLEQGIEQGLEQGLERGLEQGIVAMVSDNMEEQVPEEKIITKLVKHFSLTEEAAKDYMEKYKQQTV